MTRNVQRDVAINKPTFRGAGVAERQLFVRAARAPAAVRHANICPIYDVGEQDGQPYVVMDLVEGESLAEWLRRQGRFDDVAEAVTLVAQVGDALAAVHVLGIVHRDLKPGNILLDGSGRPVLTDFGLARAEDQDHLTSAGQLLGTPAYMAPEQAASELGPVGPWSDQYSLAVVLYQMLTGKLPFAGTTASLIFQIGSKTAPPASHLRPGLDPALERVLMKALSRQARDRYGSVADFAAALRAWQLATQVVAREQLKRVPPKRRRSFALAVGVALAASFFLALGALLLHEFTFQTEAGMLVVEVAPDADARFKDGELRIFDAKGKLVYTLKPSEKNKKLPPGDYLIEVVGADGGLKLDTKEFEIVKNGERKVLVTLAPAARQRYRDYAGRVRDAGSPRPGQGIPPEERFAWQPKEIVAVIGEHRGRQWGDITQLAWSRDGKVRRHRRTRCGRALWDPQSLRPASFRPQCEQHAQLIAPDSKTIAVLPGDGSIRLWDVSNEKPKERTAIKDIKESDVCHAWHSPRTARCWLVDVRRSKIRLWDREWGKAERSSRAQGTHGGGAHAVAFDPDGKTLASGSGDKTLRLWDLSGGEPKGEKSVTTVKSPLFPLVFSPDGKTLAQGTPLAGGIAGFTLWDVTGRRAGRERAAIKTHHPALPPRHPFVFSPDSKTLVCGSNNTDSVYIFDLSEIKPRERAVLKPGAGALAAFAPDGKSLVTAGWVGGVLRMWDLSGDEPMERLEPRGHAGWLVDALMSPDGKTLATFADVESVVRLWDLSGTAPRPPAELNCKDRVFAVAFSPDSKTLACSLGAEVQLWDLAAAEPEIRSKFRPDKAFQLRQIAFAPDGKTLVLCDRTGPENRIRLWDVSGAEPKERAVLAKSQWPFAFGPDGTWLVCGNDVQNRMPGSLQLWDLSGKEPKKASGPFGGPYSGLALSPDEKTLTRLLRVRERLGNCAKDLRGAKPKEVSIFEDSAPFNNYDNLTSIAYAPDGKTLACAIGATVSLWDVKKAKRLKKWQLPGEVSKVSFAPDGRHLITANANGTAYILRLAPPPKKEPKAIKGSG